jgi:hypothetical protein
LAPIGSMPLSLIAGAAAGDARNSISSRAPSGCRLPATTAAENTVNFGASGGSGPTISMPGIGFNSLICWKPISASVISGVFYAMADIPNRL